MSWPHFCLVNFVWLPQISKNKVAPFEQVRTRLPAAGIKFFKFKRQRIEMNFLLVDGGRLNGIRINWMRADAADAADELSTADIGGAWTSASHHRPTDAQHCASISNSKSISCSLGPLAVISCFIKDAHSPRNGRQKRKSQRYCGWPQANAIVRLRHHLHKMAACRV